MKHTRLIKATILSCLLLAACRKEETDPFNIPEGALMLTTEGFSSTGTKTYVDGTAVHWVNGDQIRINGVNGTGTTGTGANADKAYATGSWNLSTTIRAYYPAAASSAAYCLSMA